jgi:D-alanine-D-alanine ligase
MKVAVLAGGRSSEREISLRSGASVAEGLRAGGHDLVEITIEADGRWLSGDGEVSLRPGRGLLDADVAFPVLHGPFGEDGTVQGLLESLDVAYVGADVLASAICIDKITFKQVLAHHGLPQVGFCVAGADGWREDAGRLGSPLWVKPSRLGSSVGIARVDELADLDQAVEAARRHDPRVIVEAHAGGTEVECSVIGNEQPLTSVPGEIVAHADWYDFESKYEPGGMELVVPPRIAEHAQARVRALAEAAYLAVGCSGLARCDFFVNDEGEVLVNELNTIPGFTETSVFAKLFAASGIEYAELCDRLVALAVERHRAMREHAF